jgi:dihydrofolate synthase/folylpolyglutamate synthase
MTDAEVYLNGFTNWEPRLDQAGVSSFSVDRMEALLKVFRHPESALIFAHIAGSKGKGSTAAFLASILRAAGHRVGLYTSPHLYSVRERIRVLEPRPVNAVIDADPFEGMISDKDFEYRLLHYRAEIDALRAAGMDITYYEVLTAAAVAHFSARGVKVVVLETGLGGRLDATNVFEASVCGITPIGLEHTAILGDTLARIAAEKAAIIKAPSQRAAFAPQAAEALRVLMDRAALFGILPTLIGADMPVDVEREAVDGVTFSMTGRREYEALHTSLPGAHQAYNAALAAAMAEDLEAYGILLTEEAVARGISGTVWPGRFEIFPGSPVLVVDAAHTAESAQACARTFTSVFPGRKAVLLLGMSRDKNIESFCRTLEPIVAAAVAVRLGHPRSFEFLPADMERFFTSVPAVTAADVASGMAEAVRLAGKDGIILAAGSVFLAAEARR